MKQTTKQKSKSVIPTVPMFEAHEMPEPYYSLQLAGYDEDVDLYMKIAEAGKGANESVAVDTLLAMANDASYYDYGDPESGEEADPRCFTPMQSIRSLCYLPAGALKAFDRLTPLFASDDAAMREELPLLFACMGVDTLDRLITIVADKDADPAIRDGAGECLVELANNFEETALPAISALESAITDCDDEELTAYFILDLLDMGSIDSAELIDHAFRENRVDLEIVDPEYVVTHFQQLAAAYDESLQDEDASKSGDATLDRAPGEEAEVQVPYVGEEKPGRNDPCYCGSGVKYKKCHGK